MAPEAPKMPMISSTLTNSISQSMETLHEARPTPFKCFAPSVQSQRSPPAYRPTATHHSPSSRRFAATAKVKETLIAAQVERHAAERLSDRSAGMVHERGCAIALSSPVFVQHPRECQSCSGTVRHTLRCFQTPRRGATSDRSRSFLQYALGHAC